MQMTIHGTQPMKYTTRIAQGYCSKYGCISKKLTTHTKCEMHRQYDLVGSQRRREAKRLFAHDLITYLAALQLVANGGMI